MIFRAGGLAAAIAILAAACGGQAAGPVSHQPHHPAHPLSCHEQYQNWLDGPIQGPAGKLAAALRQIPAARKADDLTRLRSAIISLVPAALGLAAHPMPRCADPALLYHDLVNQAYLAGSAARSAKTPRLLLKASGQLRALEMTERRLTDETRRTAATHTRHHSMQK
jgi:hypothetical protein